MTSIRVLWISRSRQKTEPSKYSNNTTGANRTNRANQEPRALGLRRPASDGTANHRAQLCVSASALDQSQAQTLRWAGKSGSFTYLLLRSDGVCWRGRVKYHSTTVLWKNKRPINSVFRHSTEDSHRDSPTYAGTVSSSARRCRWPLISGCASCCANTSFTSTVIRQHHSSSRLAANGAPTSFSQALGSRDWLVEKASELNPSLWLLCSPVTFVPSPTRNTGHTQAAGERREAREAGGGTGLARCRSV